MPIVPTVGRKLHFFPVNDPGVQRFDSQPIDATIIYVWPKANDAHLQQVNLLVVDHGGCIRMKTSVPIVNEGDEAPPHSFYARWPAISTPTAAPIADATENTSAASAEPLMNAPDAPTAESQPDVANAPAPEIATTAEVTGPVYYSFGVALEALKAGKAATRKGWNGQGMFVYMVPAASYQAQTGIAKKVFGEGAMVPYNAYFALKGVDGTVSTWVPSVRDCIAEDWEISQ